MIFGFISAFLEEDLCFFFEENGVVGVFFRAAVSCFRQIFDVIGIVFIIVFELRYFRRNRFAVTGNKAKGKIYYHHTGYIGGMKANSFEKTIERHPEAPLMEAIKGMIPNGRLGRRLLTNVKIYAGAEHPHTAQNPQPLEV